MPINSDNPTVVPPQGEKVFDKWGYKRLLIAWPNLNGEATAAVTFTKYRRDAQGVGEEMPGSEVLWGKTDLFALAAQDAEVAQVMTLLESVLNRLAKADGAID